MQKSPGVLDFDVGSLTQVCAPMKTLRTIHLRSATLLYMRTMMLILKYM
jgi:hypothetical protein